MSSMSSSANAKAGTDYDPKKPWKAIAGAIANFALVALATYFTGTDQISWNGVLAALVSAAVQFVVTYFVPNPKVAARMGA